MFSRIHNRKGFTLIELMIVVVIIGILAALAIPRFMKATTKSKQTEAKQLLKQVYTMERAYRQENDTYIADFTAIGVEIPPTSRYAYAFNVCTAIAFEVAATANLDDDAAIDEWRIDQTGRLWCQNDDVTT